MDSENTRKTNVGIPDLPSQRKLKDNYLVQKRTLIASITQAERNVNKQVFKIAIGFAFIIIGLALVMGIKVKIISYGVIFIGIINLLSAAISIRYNLKVKEKLSKELRELRKKIET